MHISIVLRLIVQIEQWPGHWSTVEVNNDSLESCFGELLMRLWQTRVELLHFPLPSLVSAHCHSAWLVIGMGLLWFALLCGRCRSDANEPLALIDC